MISVRIGLIMSLFYSFVFYSFGSDMAEGLTLFKEAGKGRYFWIFIRGA